MGLETYILTGDNDQHQLVTDHVRVISPGGYTQRFSEPTLYDVEKVEERYGFAPELVPDYKALVGDKSDNIPNVPGIGEKTAADLLQRVRQPGRHIRAPGRTEAQAGGNPARARRSG